MTGTAQETKAYKPALDAILTHLGDPELPAGCDRWAIKTVRADLRGARSAASTQWPEGFHTNQAGVVVA